MSTSMSLSGGAIERSYNSDTSGEPIVQVLEVKRIAGQNSSDRYRLVISDGIHYQQAMLATQLNPMVLDGQVKEKSIIQLKEFLCNMVAQRRILIVINFVVIALDVDEPIGNTTNIEHAMQQKQQQQQIMGGGGGGGAGIEEDTKVKSEVPRAGPAAAPIQRGRPGACAGGVSSAAPSYMQKGFGGMGMGSPSSSSAVSSFHPINSLNPYQTRWHIKARVTGKSDMRTWEKPTGSGRLFSVDLLDSEGGQIRATMFNGAAEKFWDLFQPDKVFVISKGTLKPANKKFSRIPNDYEMTLNEDAIVEYVGEDTTIQQQKFDFISIEQILRVEANEFRDVIGIVTSVGSISSIVSTKTQKQVTKRSITITDKSLMSIELTFWGKQAEDYNERVLEGNPVIAVQNTRVGLFGGRSLSATFSSNIFINPDRPEAHELRAWYDKEGNQAQTENISKQSQSSMGGPAPRKTFSAIKDENLGMRSDSDPKKGDVFAVRATLSFIRNEFDRPPWYQACPNREANDGKGCKKKVMGDSNGGYTCESCQKTFSDYDPRYILSVLAADHTGAHWLSAFSEQAEQLLGGIKASQLRDYKAENDSTAFARVFAQAHFKTFILKIRASMEMVNDEHRVRCHVLHVSPVDYRAEARSLLQEIELYN